MGPPARATRARDRPKDARRCAPGPGVRIVAPVWTPLVVLVALTSVLLAGWAGWFALRDRAVVLRQLWGAAVVEGLLVVQLVLAIVRALGGDGPLDAPTFWGYAVTTLVVLPLAALWAFAERSRWSSVVLVVAALTVAFLQLRMVQVWGA